MKKLIAVAILTAGSLAFQSGCGWPRACCVTETTSCPATPHLAASESDVPPQATDEGVYIAERPLSDGMDHAQDAPAHHGRRAYRLYDPAAPLPPSQPLSAESSVLR